MGLSNFVNYVKSLDVNQLLECQAIIKDVIVSKSNNFTNLHISKDSSIREQRNINDYVDHTEKFVQSYDRENILSESGLLNWVLIHLQGRLQILFFLSMMSLMCGILLMVLLLTIP